MPIIAHNQQPADLPKIDPRGDLSGVDLARCAEHVVAVKGILDADQDEYQIADALREYVNTHLRPDAEMYIAVNDQLAAQKVITKAQFRNYISLVLDV
jgi:hypothetical protein